MKNAIKKTFCIFCAFITLLCYTNNVNADSSVTGFTCDASINILENGQVQISVCATTNVTVDKLSVIFYLEKYNPVSQTWEIIDIFTFEEYNTYNLCKSFTISGTEKGCYRLHGVAIAQLNGIIERIPFVTEATWIG